MTKRTTLLCALALLSGCASLPEFTGPPDSHVLYPPSAQLATNSPSPRVPTVSDVIRHIQCEIWQLPRPNSADPNRDSFASLWEDQYVVYAVLTVDVTDDGQINPALSFIHPLAAVTSRAINVSAQYGDQAHRNITQTFVLDLDPHGNLAPEQAERFCNGGEVQDRGRMEGDLGIRQIVAEGLRHTDPKSFLFPLANKADDLSDLGIGGSLTPSFGSTIDFTLTYGLGGGPNWTLTHFVGPTGASPLLNYTRTRKETLVLSFAAAGPRAAPAALPFLNPRTAEESAANEQVLRQRKASRIQAAGDTARAAATLSILQQILPSTR